MITQQSVSVCQAIDRLQTLHSTGKLQFLDPRSSDVLSTLSKCELTGSEVVQHLYKCVDHNTLLNIIDQTIKPINVHDSVVAYGSDMWNNFHLHATIGSLKDNPELVQKFLQVDTFDNLLPGYVKTQESIILTNKSVDVSYKALLNSLNGQNDAANKLHRFKIEAQHPVCSSVIMPVGYCEGHVTAQIPRVVYDKLVNFVRTSNITIVGVSVKRVPPSQYIDEDVRVSFTVRSTDISIVHTSMSMISMFLNLQWKTKHPIKIAIEYVLVDSNPNLDSAWLPFILPKSHDTVNTYISDMFTSLFH